MMRIEKFIDLIKEKYNFKIEKWQPHKSYYPEYMFLGGDRGILAYIFFLNYNYVSLAEITTKVSRAESELDRPVFFIHLGEILSDLYFETNEQIKDRLLNNYTQTDYMADMNTVGDFNCLISIMKDLKENSVNFY